MDHETTPVERVITFHAPDRTFYRVFKGKFLIRICCSILSLNRTFAEQSLDQLKEVVRQKLSLSDDSPLRLAQVLGGKIVDLDDGMCTSAFRPRILSLHILSR